METFSPKDLAGKTVKERADLARNLGRFLSISSDDTDRMTAENLASIIAADSEVKVRAALAAELRNCPFLPKEISQTIARDVEEVAEPFLLDSKALTEEVMAELAYQAGEGTREILARRSDLAEPVSFVISEVGKEKALSNLMENESAEISERVCEKATERYPENAKLMETMAERKDLPLSVIDILIHKISDKWRDRLIKKYSLAPDFASYIGGQARFNALIESLKEARGPELEAYLRRLNRERGLEGNLILQMLRQGEYECFKMAMAIRGRIPVKNVEVILDDKSENAFSRLLEKADIETSLAPVFSATFKELVRSGQI